MYEVDFLPIEKTGELGSKSGDAICLRFTEAATELERVVVIDGGYGHTGDQMVDHIRRWYDDPQRIDLIISTHPDQDHINGLGSVLNAFTVTELLIHNPHDHADDVSDFSNIEVVDALIGLAEDNGVTVVEPFTGLTRFGGQLRILGPTQAYYKQMLADHLHEIKTGENAARISAAARGGLLVKAADLLDRMVAMLPIETLAEDSETSPRNNSSVVTLLTTDDGERMVFTGDAGIPALNAALDEYELLIGGFSDFPLDFFQAPHHGSKRNLAPSVLNRIFGRPGESVHAPTSFISSAKNDPKHPSPKVTNALKRRGADVYATESKTLLHKSNMPMRPGYGPAIAIEPLEEDDD